MHKDTILVGVITFLIGGVGGYAISEITSDYSRHECKASMHGSNGSKCGGSEGTTRGDMMSGTDNEHLGMGHAMMAEHKVNSEYEFLSLMIPHHQEAVTAAQVVLKQGATTPEIQTLMENIISAQEAEISDMKAWYEQWYGAQYQDDGSYVPMMRDLRNLSGTELDRAFLEDMIPHHMGAIMMAQSVESHIEHEEIETLSQAIISTQTSEIDLMRSLLSEL